MEESLAKERQQAFEDKMLVKALKSDHLPVGLAIVKVQEASDSEIVFVNTSALKIADCYSVRSI